MTVEAVNSSLQYASVVRANADQTSTADGSGNPQRLQKASQGPYVSPYVSSDSTSAKALNGRSIISNDVYRAIPVPYEWVPAGTPHSEKPVAEPNVFNLTPTTN